MLQQSPAMVNQLRESSGVGELEPTSVNVNIDGASPRVASAPQGVRMGVRSPTEVGSLPVVDHFKGIYLRLRGGMGAGLLPVGWTEHRSQDGGKYYHHLSAEMTQWERPSRFTVDILS